MLCEGCHDYHERVILVWEGCALGASWTAREHDHVFCDACWRLWLRSTPLPHRDAARCRCREIPAPPQRPERKRGGKRRRFRGPNMRGLPIIGPRPPVTYCPPKGPKG